MNILKSAKNVYDTIQTASVNTHSVEAKLAYEDCLSLLMVLNEQIEVEIKGGYSDFAEFAGAFAKFAKKQGVEAI